MDGRTEVLATGEPFEVGMIAYVDDGTMPPAVLSILENRPDAVVLRLSHPDAVVQKVPRRLRWTWRGRWLYLLRDRLSRR